MHDKYIIQIINKANDIYTTSYKKSFDLLESNNDSTNGIGGQLRVFSGEVVENIIEMIIGELIKQHKRKDSFIINGKSDGVIVKSKNGEHKFSVDRHVHLNDINKTIFIECKSYTDSCYVGRADLDLMNIKKKYKNSNRILVALQYDISQKSQNYFLDQGNIEKIFYLVDGKRKSKYPLWRKEFHKELNYDKLYELVSYLNGIFC